MRSKIKLKVYHLILSLAKRTLSNKTADNARDESVNINRYHHHLLTKSHNCVTQQNATAKKNNKIEENSGHSFSDRVASVIRSLFSRSIMNLYCFRRISKRVYLFLPISFIQTFILITLPCHIIINIF